MSVANQVTEFVYRITRDLPWGELPLKDLVDDAERVREDFFLFLRNGGRVVDPQRVFPIFFRSVILGRHKTPKAYLASIESHGRTFNKWVRVFAGRVLCAQVEIELPLYDVSGANLDFKDAYTYEEYLVRAATLGLYHCPAETGLALADQFDDQPCDDFRRIGMKGMARSSDEDRRIRSKSLVVSIDDRYAFSVVHDEEGLCLKLRNGRPLMSCHPLDRWLLTTHKPTSSD